MTVRLASVREMVEMVGWLRAQSEQNDLDEEVLDYPTATFVRAGDKKAECYLPCHATLTLESLAVDQSLPPLSRVKAAIRCVQFAEELARTQNLREVYFLPSSHEASEIATKHLGYSPVTALRKKL